MLEEFVRQRQAKTAAARKAFAEAVTQSEIPATISSSAKELLRGVRMHLARFTKGLDLPAEQIQKAQLGLGHAFSRNKMQFDPNRQDKPILNTIALLDGLDKNINTFAMRVREW